MQPCNLRFRTNEIGGGGVFYCESPVFGFPQLRCACQQLNKHVFQQEEGENCRFPFCSVSDGGVFLLPHRPCFLLDSEGNMEINILARPPAPVPVPVPVAVPVAVPVTVAVPVAVPASAPPYPGPPLAVYQAPPGRWPDPTLRLCSFILSHCYFTWQDFLLIIVFAFIRLLLAKICADGNWSLHLWSTF